MELIKKLLNDCGITEYGVIDFDKLTVINERLLPDTPVKSALLVLLPYRTGNIKANDSYNIGLFGRIKDYHMVFAGIADKLTPEFKNNFGGEVSFYADHSPVHEKEAAAKCGLGFIGHNSLLINPKYGSFVFIGCFLFSKRLEERLLECNYNCGKCAKCIELCPTGAIDKNGINVDRCLSGVSQKKKKTEEELKILQQTKTVWGCDICQNACPYNRNALFSQIAEFDSIALKHISAEIIEEMEDAQYKQYAFSYRPKKVITENFLTADGKRDIIN
ncbi:MAG: epoxyqueuosine reductase [Ruminococcaceae bacterium]|nr:epoxyqueuosine reductase [Oscillospiraceae bacterium]